MKPNTGWRRLDNAAKIFPPNTSGRDPKVFRFTCELHEAVNQAALQTATEKTLEEFPFFRYTMRRGMFWYYLEDSRIIPCVEEEREAPCQPLYRDASSALFRVSFWNRRINFEVYHVLSDGAGAIQFLRVLVCRYLQMVHREALDGANLDLGISATMNQKMRDSFDQYYAPGAPGRNMPEPRAYKIRGHKLPSSDMRVIIGELSVKSLLAEARRRGTTITVLLAACFVTAIGDEMEVRYRKRPVAVSVPVNLRKYFPSDTARNFFSLVNLGVDFSKIPCETEAVTAALTAEIEGRLTQEYLQNRLNTLARLEKNPILRVFPLALKDPVLSIAGRIGDSKATVALSNVGKIAMPDALAPYIRKFDVFISTGGMQLCSCSYGDVLSVGFTSAFAHTDIERRFFRKLSDMGIELTISANQTEDMV